MEPQVFLPYRGYRTLGSLPFHTIVLSISYKPNTTNSTINLMEEMTLQDMLTTK